MSRLIPWKPFGDLDTFLSDEDWMFPVFSRGQMSAPAMDLYETDQAVIAELNVPGYDADKITVEVKDGMLEVRGSMEEKTEDTNKGYWKREIRSGSFRRMAKLPVRIQEDATEATYEKGVLKVTMPKAKQQPSSGVKVQVVKK